MKGAFRFPMIKIEGSGGSDPDPAVYCPANGYILEPGQDPYIPPVDIGTPGNEEIIILCSNTEVKYLSAKCGMSSSGQWYAEVYDGNGNYIETSANMVSNNTYAYSFPSGYDYFIFKFKAVGTSTFLSYINGNYTSAPFYGDYPILEVKFNTPNITTLQNAFSYVRSIRKVTFECTLNSLTNMSYMFQYGGMKLFTFPTSLPALTTVAYMFQYNGNIEKVDMGSSNVPVLSLLNNMFYASPSIYQTIFPSSMPEATNFTGCFYNSGLTKLMMPTSAPKVTTYSSFCRGSSITGTIIIPESLVCTNIDSAFNTCSKVEKVIFQGNFPLCTVAQNICANAFKITEFEFPRTMGNVSGGIGYGNFTNTYELRKLRLPDYSLETIQFSVVGSVMGNKVEHFWGDLESPNAFTARDFYYPYGLVSIIDMPYFQAYRFNIGSSNAIAPVTYINIDWARFNPGSSPGTPIIISANLDATELNRIFTLLPIVTPGMYNVAVQSCPGYATCNPAIATAKGWGVY